MDTIENKAVSRNFVESYNQKDLDKSFDDYIAMDLINHTMGGGFTRQSWLDFDKAYLTAVPDNVTTVKDQLAEGDRVFTHFIMTGTHKGQFMDKTATGNKITFEAFVIDKIKDGKIIEHHTLADFTAFMMSFSKIV
jgi:predicted ester cyclase